MTRHFCAFVLACCATIPAFAAVEYTGKTYPDPFVDKANMPAGSDPKKQVQAKPNFASLTVEGIVISPGGNLAIVKGKVVREGENVQNFRVHSIEADGVTFVYKAAGQDKLHKVTHKGKLSP